MARKRVAFTRRGEVWWINFAPSIGTEVRKTRPAVIVSNDIANEFLESIQVVPLTSNVEKIYPSEAIVQIRGKKSKAAADQIATVSKLRVYRKVGRLSSDELTGVEYVLRVQLGL